MAKGGGRRPRVLGFEGLVEIDILGNLRRLEGKENLLWPGRKKSEDDLGEVEKITRSEKAVKMTSGSEAGGFPRRWRCDGGSGGCGGGCDGGISDNDRTEDRKRRSRIHPRVCG